MAENFRRWSMQSGRSLFVKFSSSRAACVCLCSGRTYLLSICQTLDVWRKNFLTKEVLSVRVDSRKDVDIAVKRRTLTGFASSDMPPGRKQPCSTFWTTSCPPSRTFCLCQGARDNPEDRSTGQNRSRRGSFRLRP